LADSLTIASCAKLNYTLDILSLRPDGYHNLASVMQVVSLADSLTLTRREEPGIAIRCDAPGVPADESNLAFRAAAAALQAAGREDGLNIRLDKRIPSQAGLGGGSSNAAYILRGVNLLLKLGLSDARLLELAAGLGSDVPFFLIGGTAAVRGRGERMTALPDGPPLWFVVVKPEVNVSTAWAYAALDAMPDRISARATRRMEEAVRTGDAEQVIRRMTNDFEAVIFDKHLPLALLCDEFLMARACNARLCGSGAAVFGVARSRTEAEEVARLMRLKYPRVHVCRALARAESLALREPSEEAKR
jgi:4-diphosphocytidyl-2-C-methyl-D-erythritol kinase